MAFPLATVLAAAPGIVSAAADIIRIIRNTKQTANKQQADTERVEQLAGLVEQQALLIEELAVNNRNMALAVRNSRRLSLASISIGILAVGLAVLL